MNDDKNLAGPTSRLFGQLEARMAAMEDRLSRHETTCLAHQASVEAKLDRLANTLALGIGGLKLAYWIGGAALTVTGFLANHFLHSRT